MVTIIVGGIIVCSLVSTVILVATCAVAGRADEAASRSLAALQSNSVHAQLDVEQEKPTDAVSAKELSSNLA